MEITELLIFRVGKVSNKYYSLLFVNVMCYSYILKSNLLLLFSQLSNHVTSCLLMANALRYG